MAANGTSWPATLSPVTVEPRRARLAATCRENFPYSFKSRLRRLAARVLASLRAAPPRVS
jgi:hypothetical protein